MMAWVVWCGRVHVCFGRVVIMTLPTNVDMMWCAAQHVRYSLARAQFDYLVANLSSIDMIGKSGLVENASCLVDWPSGMMDHFVRSPTSTIASAWVYYGITTLVDMASLLGRTADAIKLNQTGIALKAAMNAKQWNGSAFCDGQCAEVNHTAFHSSMYALAFGAVSDEHADAAWAYVRHRIDPPFSTPARQAVAPPPAPGAPRPRVAWPPPGPSSGLGLPCGVHPSQFAVAALYKKASDLGNSAFAVLTSTAKNSWLNMLKQGATMTMEMWTPDEKPNLTVCRR